MRGTGYPPLDIQLYEMGKDLKTAQGLNTRLRFG